MTWTTPQAVASVLLANHYLGPIRRGRAWSDEHGVIVLSQPTARRLPGTWLELTRWCITSREKNAGSRQWGALVKALRIEFPETTTIVSYSDPSVGHTGTLYRACNWLWAPTWHRLRPPPSGNGSWSDGSTSGVKDRWVFELRPDAAREHLLRAKDEAVLRRMPWATYVGGQGANFKRFKELTA